MTEASICNQFYNGDSLFFYSARPWLRSFELWAVHAWQH